MSTRTFTEATHRVSTGTYLPGRGWSIQSDSCLLSEDDSCSTSLPPVDSASTLILLCTSNPTPALTPALAQIRSHYARSPILTFAGTAPMHAGHLHPGELTFAATTFARATLSSASAPLRNISDSCNAGKFLGLQLAKPGLRAVILTSTTSIINADALIEGLYAELGSTTLFGALAPTPHISPAHTNEHATVSAVGLFGDSLRIGTGVRLGLEPFGPPRHINISNGTIITQIDGRPALEVYKRLLGPKAAQLPGAALLFPLVIKVPGGLLTRAVTQIDESTGSIHTTAPIPQGTYVHLARAEFDSLINASSEAAWEAAQGTDDLTGVGSSGGSRGACLGLTLACSGRHLLLGQRADEEASAAMLALPRGSAHLGCYTGAVIAPYLHSTHTLSQAIGMLTLREE
jgi:hypothetical protein